MRPLIVLLLVAACASERVDDTTEAEPQALTSSVIARRSEWRYWDGGGNLGSSWRGAFDDSSWAAGAGPLGYGETYLATTIGYGPSSSNKYITSYFRRTFTIDDPAAVTAMTGEVMYDDGFVVYLNGIEIGRQAMPAGTISATTLSTGHEAGNAYRTYDWTTHVDQLVAGENVLAIEVHQAAASSSDLAFDAALTVETPDAPPPPLVDMGGFSRHTFWYYWDHASTPPASWKTQPYGQWPDWDADYGPFGYGESYVNTVISYGSDPAHKPITSYYTKSFHIDNPSAVTQMIAELMYDDGFVAYLNGVEIARRHMPGGTVTGTTPSTGHEAGNAYVTIDLGAYRTALVPGDNVIAVEVHQASASSSDLVFDMSLSLEGEEPPPPPPTGEDIARGSEWRYWDLAAAPSDYDSWAGPEYNDAAWGTGAGPLGYGESYLETTISYGSDPANKPVTTYFRRWFTVDEPSVQTTLIAELMYDDGVVIHLNGHEVARRAMPTGEIGHTTRSTGHEANNAYQVIDLSDFNGHLVAGANLIAVEVHQQAASSSDLVFDLSLQVDTPAVCGVPGGGGAAPPAPSTGLGDIWVGPTTVMAVGGGGTIGRREAGDWCWSKPYPDVGWNALWGAADDDVWIVGSAGNVVHYDGAAFTPVDVGATSQLFDISGSGPDDIWIVESPNIVRHFDGAGWTSRPVTVPDTSLFGVWSHSPDDVWVVGSEPAPYPGNDDYDGSSGVVYRWNPGTGDWDLVLKVVVYYGFGAYYAIHGTGPDDIWVIGNEHPAGAACEISALRHFDGTSWHSIPGAPTECSSLYDIAAGAPAAEDGAWIAGRSESGWTESGTARYSGGAWTYYNDDPLADSLGAIDHLDDRMWAVGWLGSWNTGTRQKIVRWDGGGWVQEW